MADIRSRPSTDTYRENWDRVFGKSLPKNDGETWVVLPGEDPKYVGGKVYIPIVHPEWAAAYESLDSHPVAD